MFRTLKKVSKTIIVLTFFCGNLALGYSDIFISQVQINGGKGKTEQDFIELFNPNSERLNLKGYRLVKRTEAGSSDVLIKVWTKDTFIPAKSFYLWSNKSYGVIRADSNSSATISEDNGIGLRIGANDTGQLIDSVSWGKANNGFNKVTNINPGALKSIQRKDIYSSDSNFIIDASSPHNSTVNDLSAEFLSSQNKKEVVKPVSTLIVKKVEPEEKILGSTTTATIASVVEEEGVVLEGTIQPSDATFEVKKETHYINKYLFISLGGVVLLVLILFNYGIKKN